MAAGAVAENAILGLACFGGIQNHDFDLFLRSNHRSGMNLFIFDLSLLDLLSLEIRQVIVMNNIVLRAEERRLTWYQ